MGNATDRDQWLAQVREEILEPALSICDPHHHLGDHPGRRYLLDTGSGHKVAATVFVECLSMYRANGPEAMRPVGETEFVSGVAAIGASGPYGATRVAAGVGSFADLTLPEENRVGRLGLARQGQAQIRQHQPVTARCSCGAV